MVRNSEEPETVRDVTDEATRLFSRGRPEDTNDRARALLGSLIEDALPSSQRGSETKMRMGDIMRPSARQAITEQHADALLCDANDWDESRAAPVAARPSHGAVLLGGMLGASRGKASWDRPVTTIDPRASDGALSASSWPAPPSEWTPESQRRVPSVFPKRDDLDSAAVLAAVPAQIAMRATESPTFEVPVAKRPAKKGYLLAAVAAFGLVVLGGASALGTAAYVAHADSPEGRAPVVTGPALAPTLPAAASNNAELATQGASTPARPKPADAILVEDLRLVAPEGIGSLAIGTQFDGHRVFVDGALIGRAPGFFKVRCGLRKVRVLTTERAIDVPCGGEVAFAPPTH